MPTDTYDGKTDSQSTAWQVREGTGKSNRRSPKKPTGATHYGA